MFPVERGSPQSRDRERKNSESSAAGAVVSTLADLLNEQEAAKEETERRAREIERAKEGKSAKTAVLSDKYWEEYSLRTDARSQLVFKVHLLLSSNKFDAAIGVVILANSVMIGVQT